MSHRYFDIQLNGYGGVDYNSDDLTLERLRESCMALRAGDVDQVLVTIITEQVDILVERVRRVAKFIHSDALIRDVVAGIHVEGPFISPEPGYRGAHPVDAIHEANESETKRIVDAAEGELKLLTLAPEMDPGFEVTKWLAGQDIVVSAGHTNASVEQLEGAIDAGLSMFTHLGNGCPMTMHRHDNIVQRALGFSDRLWLCFIADGAHVPFVALKNYLRCIGLEKCIVTTDAIAPAGKGPGRYIMSRWDIVVGEDMVPRSPDGSHFVGSAITMEATARNLAENLGLTPDQIDQVMCVNPRRSLALAA